MRLRREVHTRQSVLQHLSNYCACERAPTKPSKSPPANPNSISDTTQLRTGMSADIRCHTNRSTRGADGALNALIKRAQHGKPRVGGGPTKQFSTDKSSSCDMRTTKQMPVTHSSLGPSGCARTDMNTAKNTPTYLALRPQSMSALPRVNGRTKHVRPSRLGPQGSQTHPPCDFAKSRAARPINL